MTSDKRHVGIIGDPVAHSYSPRFQQAAFDALFRRAVEVSGDYEPLFTLESWRAIVEKRADGRV